MYLGVRLYGDSSRVSTRSMFLHPARARAVNAPHTFCTHLTHLCIFNCLNSYPLLPDKCFTPEGPSCSPPLSASCFEGPPYVSRQLMSSSPPCLPQLLLTPLPFFLTACPALKSTPDDFLSLFSPLPLQPLFLPSERCHQARTLQYLPPSLLLHSSLSLAPWLSSLWKHASIHSPPLSSLPPYHLPIPPSLLFASTDPQMSCTPLSPAPHLQTLQSSPLSLAPSGSSCCLSMGE